MSDFKEYAELFKLIYGDMQVESNEEKDGIIIFSLAPGELQRVDFDLVVYKCKKLGYLPFTVEDEHDRLFVIKLDTKKNSNIMLRVALAIITLISIIYSGYVYSAFYNSSSVGEIITTDLLMFSLPMVGFLIFRELGRYFARTSAGMNYSLPIFIPDPIFFGTGGSISTSDEVYKDRKTMIECGGVPILFGFVYSIFIIVVGGLISPNYALSGPAGNMPYTSIGYPVAFYYFFSFAIPFNGFINPMVFVGWVGLFVSALNFIPVGYLDGGVFWKGIVGKEFRYVSYVSVAALIGVGLVFPEMIIIPVFSIFLGLNGAEPLNGATPLPNYATVALVMIALIFLISMIPIHHLPSQVKLSVQMGTSTLLVVSGSGGNHTNFTTADFTISIFNEGNVPFDPSFSISPSIPFNHTATEVIQPDARENVTFSANTSGLSLGLHNYSLTVYSGTYSTTTSMTLIMVQATPALLFNGDSNPLYIYNGVVGMTINLTLDDEMGNNTNVSLYVITSVPIDFTMSINASQFYRESSSNPGIPISFNSFQVTPFNTTSIRFTADESPHEVEIVVMAPDFQAAICIIDYI